MILFKNAGFQVNANKFPEVNTPVDDPLELKRKTSYTSLNYSR